jgi:hypothetical protein
MWCSFFYFMVDPSPSDTDLLKSILQPLFEDFQYWFGRSRHLLETQRLSFMEPQQQADLLDRVKQAQQEVSSAQMLFQATNGTAGVQMDVLMPWHQLLTECWQVAMRFRQEQTAATSSESGEATDPPAGSA